MDVNYFEEPDCTAQGFNNLQTLHINKFYGSRTELRFVRFILGSAPLLRKAILLVDSSINESQSLKISKELMRFPRASPKSEIVFEPWSKVQTRLVLRCWDGQNSFLNSSSSSWFLPSVCFIDYRRGYCILYLCIFALDNYAFRSLINNC